MSANHPPETCSVMHCKRDASRWIETAGTDLERIGHTFYFCDEHAEKMSPDDDVVQLVSHAGEMIEKELAVYGCTLDICDGSGWIDEGRDDDILEKKCPCTL